MELVPLDGELRLIDKHGLGYSDMWKDTGLN
jgi:hypothetical protein